MRNPRQLMVFSLLLVLILNFESEFSPVSAEISDSSDNLAKSSYFFEFTITESNEELYFYPAGLLATEVGGKIRLDYVGDYMEYGSPQAFYNVTVFYADGRVNATISNVSEATVGMNFIWGFGGFSPNLISPVGWGSQDALARQVADAPASDPWPAMNGTLNISSAYGRHTYEYAQNPANGTQETSLTYDETSGVLLAFRSQFEGYSLSAMLKIDTSSLYASIQTIPKDRVTGNQSDDSPTDDTQLDDFPADDSSTEGFSISGGGVILILITSAGVMFYLTQKRKWK